MSWVLMMVVMPYSWVISLIRRSITIEVLGSSPELGSSQNRYLGFMMMPRAMATRLRIPPESSEGYLACTPSRLTRWSAHCTRSSISPRFFSENIIRGNITFSPTLIESNKAPP